MDYIGLNKYQLDTPVLVIDKTKLLTNLAWMQEFAQQKQVHLRPHAKTHKCSQIAALQLEYGAVGICVAKVSEGYELAKTGIRGILITSPVVTETKVKLLLALLKMAPDTMVVIDNWDNALYLNRVCLDHQLTLNILLDIDAGIHRTGVAYANAVAMAQKLNELSNLNFQGIQCYAGHIQHIPDLKARSKMSQQILAEAVQIKQQLCDLGIPCLIQTGSGTGTFAIDAEISGVSEIQPGSYCVMDKEYQDIQSTKSFIPAMTLLTTVISINHKDHVTVDAGTKSIYQVTTKPKVISHQHLSYDWGGFGDEHGKIVANEGSSLPQLGEVLELIVAHCDPTVNLFDHFYITEDDIVVERWDINLRGKSC